MQPLRRDRVERALASLSIPSGSTQRFPAVLSPRYRLVSITLGFGVGVLLPALIGLGAAAIYGEYWALALPLPFLALIGIAALFRPRAFAVGNGKLSVVRGIGAVAWPIAEMKVARMPPDWPKARPVSVLATRGLFGSYGWFWCPGWGFHRIYLTDPDTAIELERRDGRRIVITPSDPRGFLAALSAAARNVPGAALAVERA